MCAVLISVIFCTSMDDEWRGSNWRFWSIPVSFVSNTPIITGTTFVLTFHFLLTSISRSLYLLSFSVSFVLTFQLLLLLLLLLLCTINYSVSALSSFTLVLSDNFYVTYTTEFPIGDPDSRVIRIIHLPLRPCEAPPLPFSLLSCLSCLSPQAAHIQWRKLAFVVVVSISCVYCDGGRCSQSTIRSWEPSFLIEIFDWRVSKVDKTQMSLQLPISPPSLKL
jgi:hypothetical protein